MIEVIGWVGSFLFSICAIPQAYQSYKEKSSKGINSLFLITWFLGEILCLLYGFLVELPYPIMVNYIVNLSCLLVIAYYKVKK